MSLKKRQVTTELQPDAVAEHQTEKCWSRIHMEVNYSLYGKHTQPQNTLTHTFHGTF